MLPQISMTVKGVVLLIAAVYAFAALLRREDAEWVKGAPLKVFVGMFLLGMWGHSVWVLYLAIIIAIPLLSRSKADAAAIYMVTIIAVPPLYYKVAVGSIYLMPFTKYLFAMAGLAIAIASKSGPRGRLGSRFDIPVLLVIILELIAERDPSITELMRQELPILLNIALPYFLVSRALTTSEDLRRFVLAIALGGFVMAIVATVEAHTHWLIYKQMETYLHLGSQTNAYQQVRGGMLRAPGSFPESTSLGNFLALAAVAILALRHSFASNAKWYAAIGALAIGVFAPNSRGALLGLGAGWLLFDFYRKNWPGLFTKLGLAGGAYLLLLTAAQFSNYSAELVGKGQATKASTEYRVLLLHRGLEEIRKHPFGTNIKTALNNLEDIRQGQHIIDLVNGYISYGLTSGYAGMVGLFLVFATLCAAMLSARRNLVVDPMMRDLAAFVFGVSGFLIIISAFTSFGGEGSTAFYMVAAVGSSIYALRRTALGRAANPAAAAVPTYGPPIRGQILADREAARGRRPKPSMEMS